MVSERPKASFTVKNLDQDLPRLLQSGSVEHHRDVLDRPNASAALAGKSKYLSRGQAATENDFNLKKQTWPEGHSKCISCGAK